MAQLPNIVILGDYERALRRFSKWEKLEQQANLKIHHEPLRDEALYEAVKDADAIAIVRDRSPFNEAMIARLPKLKFLMFTGERNGTLEASALVSRNIPMACTHGGPSKETTAELTWALILGASKRLIEENKLIASGGWRDELSLLPMLSGQRLGVMGLGAIGSRVARAGQLSALLAKHGFTASPKALEAGRGYMQTVSTKCDWSEIDRALGKSFEISLNTYKPFACGIVIHPAIDACAQLRAQGVKADDVERIELRVHPLVLELTGKKTPKDGLEGKFSVYHGCAVGLIFGQAGEGEYADDIVNRADVVALRAKVNATTDTAISEASVDVKAILKDGKEVHVFVKNAIGSVENPMSDTNLEQKFTSLAEPIIGTEKTRQLISALWKLGSASDLKHILSLCTPD
jgi:hypothetical protein